MASIRTVMVPVAAGALVASTLLGGPAAFAGPGTAAGTASGSTSRMTSADGPQPRAVAGLVLPPVNGAADYQLGGGYPPTAGTDIVTRDITEKPAPGTYGICYINAFQTQGPARTWWLSKHPRLVLRDAQGRPVHDPGWPAEMLLDTSTSAKRQALLVIEARWLDRCLSKGFRGVEPDNLDSWTRSHKRLTMRQNAAFATSLVQAAHARGLAIAQKNDTAMLRLHAQTHFDFAVAEECQVYDECGRYRRVYGRHLIEVEYPDNGGLTGFRAACRTRGAAISIVYRDRNLVPRGHSGYVYRRC